VCAAAGIAAAAALAGELLAQQQPVFRSRADLVTVDVVVTDSNDRPITDLTADEFAIVQGGRRQTITDFEFVSIPNANRTLDVEGVVQPPPDVATNEPPPDTSRAFVMVVDDRHLLTHDIIPTKRVMTDFLRALGPGDQVALVFVGRSDLSTDFTTDIASLLASVEAVQEVFGFGLPAWLPPGDVGVRDGVHVQAKHYANQTIETLRNVLRTLTGSDHARRALVFVSAGFNLNPSARYLKESADAAQVIIELQAVYAEAARANVPVYTLDPRGMVMWGMAVASPLDVDDEEQILEVLERIRLQNDRMAEIAINTGGRAFIKQSNLTAAVEQIVADNGNFYLLGYYPDPHEEDGKYHDIDVQVTRPGVRVRARSGYVAPTPAGEIVDAEASFAGALGQGMPASGLQLRALATPLGAAPEGRVTTGITVQVTYDPQDAAAGVPDEQLRFAVLALDPDARIRMSDDQTFSVSLPPNASGPVTMEINHVVGLPRGPSALRLGVASRATGRTGTVHLPIDLPDLADDRLALGGIVVGHAAATTQPRAASPEFQALLPFPPAIAREFDAADTLAVFVRVFAPPDAEGELRAALTVARDGEVLQAAAVTCSRSVSRQDALDCIADLPLDALAPGGYALTFAARVAGGEPVSRAIPFIVR
jgi:VWFA-related protein